MFLVTLKKKIMKTVISVAEKLREIARLAPYQKSLGQLKADAKRIDNRRGYILLHMPNIDTLHKFNDDGFTVEQDKTHGSNQTFKISY